LIRRECAQALKDEAIKHLRAIMLLNHETSWVENTRIKYIAVLILAVLYLVNCAWGSTDYQEVLLSFYSQQLVSHGAQLFAASIIAITFITRFIHKLDRRRSRVFFIVSSGFLLGIVIFILFRLLVYGALSSAVISFPITEPNNNSLSNCTLGDYAVCVQQYAFAKNATFTLSNNVTYAIGREAPLDTNLTFIGSYFGSSLLWFSDFLSNFSGGWLTSPFGLPICFYVGWALAYMIYWAFPENSCARFNWKKLSEWLWFIYFAIPAILGLLGAFEARGEHGEIWLMVPFALYYLLLLAGYKLKIHEKARALWMSLRPHISSGLC
jgi:hypothetical protein